MDKTRFKELMLEKSVTVKRRLTYSDVAHETGLSAGTVERFANDRFNEPSYRLVARLAQYFCVSASYLMRESDERWPGERNEPGQRVGVATVPA